MVRLGVDRMAPRHQFGQCRAGLPAASSGRMPFLRMVRATSVSRSARSQTESAACLTRRAGLGIDEGAATKREDLGGLGEQPCNHPPFELAKARLAVEREDVGDAHPRRRDDLLVRVLERRAQKRGRGGGRPRSCPRPSGRPAPRSAASGDGAGDPPARGGVAVAGTVIRLDVEHASSPRYKAGRSEGRQLHKLRQPAPATTRQEDLESGPSARTGAPRPGAGRGRVPRHLGHSAADGAGRDRHPRRAAAALSRPARARVRAALLLSWPRQPGRSSAPRPPSCSRRRRRRVRAPPPPVPSPSCRCRRRPRRRSGSPRPRPPCAGLSGPTRSRPSCRTCRPPPGNDRRALLARAAAQPAGGPDPDRAGRASCCWRASNGSWPWRNPRPRSGLLALIPEGRKEMRSRSFACRRGSPPTAPTRSAAPRPVPEPSRGAPRLRGARRRCRRGPAWP